MSEQVNEQGGRYEKVGDVEEWVWDEGAEPMVSVPKGEFDPRDAVEPKPKPKKAVVATKGTK